MLPLLLFAAAFLLERTIQLQTALDSRVVIEQAKGILMRDHQCDAEEAFENALRVKPDLVPARQALASAGEVVLLMPPGTEAYVERLATPRRPLWQPWWARRMPKCCSPTTCTTWAAA